MDSDLNPVSNIPSSETPPLGDPAGPVAAGGERVVASPPAPGTAEEGAPTTLGAPSAGDSVQSRNDHSVTEEHIKDLAGRLRVEPVAHVIDTIKGWLADHELGGHRHARDE